MSHTTLHLKPIIFISPLSSPYLSHQLYTPPRLQRRTCSHTAPLARTPSHLSCKKPHSKTRSNKGWTSILLLPVTLRVQILFIQYRYFYPITPHSGIINQHCQSTKTMIAAQPRSIPVRSMVCPSETCSQEKKTSNRLLCVFLTQFLCRFNHRFQRRFDFLPLTCFQPTVRIDPNRRWF